jgi:type I restriction enzyme R subunit
MYIYKPMKGYNLMQAIARVNRVFKDKECGLIVDYVGIASALKEAMNDYTARDRKNYGDTDVAKVAYPKFQEKLSVCRDLFYGYDYSDFIHGSNLARSRAISGAVNFIVAVGKEDDRDTFLKEALMLKQALSLCSSLAAKDERIEAAFFESVRVLVNRLVNQGEGKKISLPEMNARINNLLKASIHSDGVINLFQDANSDFSLFDLNFLQEIANMKEKNLAVELLKKLITEQVVVYKHTNVVKSEKFSEILQKAMNQYLNGMLTNEQIIEEMLNLAKQIQAAQKEGEKLGLTADELAFYDALTKPQAIKDFYENEELIAITKELADTLRKNRTIEWQKWDSARAKMRMLIKRLLKHHKYPPEGMDDAVQTVMTQCELWADSNDMGERVSAYSDRLNQYVNETYDMGMVAEPKAQYGKKEKGGPIMAVPKYDELMKPLLIAVSDGETYKMKDVTALLAEQLNLSSDDLAEMLPSRRQTVFKNRVGWAKTYLKKAGLLDSPARATIVITNAGKQVVADNPEKIDSKYLEQFPSFVDFVSAPEPLDDSNPASEVPKPSDLTPDD